MDDGGTGLYVDFAINTGASEEELMRLSAVMNSVEGKLVAQAASIERATGSMLKLPGGIASVTAAGSAVSKELQAMRREKNLAESAGERLIKQLDREATAFGRTKQEMRIAKVEAAALAAEKVGNIDLAQRLTAANDMLYAKEAAAIARVRGETEAFAQQKAALAATATQTDLSARGTKLQESINPAIAAQNRYNAEMAEARTLIAANAITLDDYAAKLQQQTTALNTVSAGHAGFTTGIGNAGNAGKFTGNQMQNLAFQFQDLGVQMVAAAGSSNPLKLAFMALMQQGSQISGVMMQSGLGIRAVGAAFLTMSRTILVAAATNPYLLAIGATIGLFAGAVSLLNKTANESSAVSDYAKSLGLTKDEIEKLGGATVTWGDTTKAIFQVAGAAIWGSIGPAVTSVWDLMKGVFGWLMNAAKNNLNFVIGYYVGAYNIITQTWRSFPAVLGDLFYSGVNAGIDAINRLIQASVNGVNGFISAANSILSQAGLELPMLTNLQVDRVNNQYAGAAKKFGNTVSFEMKKALSTDWAGDAGAAVSGAVSKQAQENAKGRIYAAAKDKGYLDEKDGKKGTKDKSASVDKHAEALMRDANAVAAQIKNLYVLTDAYKQSGTAALIAEARLKAESDAIKDRANIEQRIGEQIQLSIAQRVSDAAKATASIREQANAQSLVNDMVFAGTLSAERASEWVKDQIADLPLLAALQVAQQRGLADEAEKATGALADQRAERERLRALEEVGAYNKEIQSSQDQVAIMREEYRLIGASNAERTIALATIKATQEAKAKFTDPAISADYIKNQVYVAQITNELADNQRNYNDELNFTADKWDLILGNMQIAASGIADAFGKAGSALGGLASTYANFQANRASMDTEHQRKLLELQGNAEATARAEQLYAVKTANVQIGMYGDMASAAKGFFKEKSAGYKALAAAEKVFRAIQFAMSVRAMVQDGAETASSIGKSILRTAQHAVEAVAKAIASLPFPANLVAGAATIAALASIGVSIAGSFGGGGKDKMEKANTGTGTVFGDSQAQSESIKNALSQLKDVDLLMLNTSRQMAASLQAIESNISGFASLLVRQSGNINASGGVAEGFKANAAGKVLGALPLIGDMLKGLFGTKTTVVGNGLFGGPQALGNVLSSGFDASYYSDVQKKKKLFGVTTSSSYSTQYAGADASLENQFTLILRNFNSAILAAGGPLGAATSDIQTRLNGFIVNIGKIDLKGLTGAQIEEKLNAVFGAAADDMARAAFPLIDKYQKVGEGTFETLVRVASTIEAVGASLGMLGSAARNLGFDVKLGLADQFENVGALTSAVNSYFQTYYTKEEQAASRTSQLAGVFGSLGLAMPSTLAAFRSLVDAQDLTSASGLETYATLIKLAPAFADLQAAMDGAKSATDIASERMDLQRQLLELQGNTAAIRALQLAKLDASNRGLQQQIWAMQDAQAAAKAADELRKAWTSVGDTIMDEVKRIRGITDVAGGNGFAALQGQFNSATALARGGDQDAAKKLPQLSQALLTAAADVATSRQELDRVQAQTAASLETTFIAISAFAAIAAPLSNTALLDAISGNQNTDTASNNNNSETLAQRFDDLRGELVQLRTEMTTGLSVVAGNTGSIKRSLDNVTSQSGGDAIATVAAA